ncbi:hypothetical protein MTO96_012403 [Rhipicephalus appendiculatus]
MLSGSSKLASFYQRASAYEKRVGISYCECCSTRKIFWIDVKRCCLCVLYIIAVALTEPQAPSELRGVLAQAIHFSTILLFTLLWLIYDIMYSVSLKSAALAFCEYMDRELHVLKIFEDYHCIGFNRQADIARRVEEINRLHDSIDPESMAFKGADFFTLKMSLVVSVWGLFFLCLHGG